MAGLARRLDRLEHRYGTPAHDHPARVPDWMRPWLDRLSIEDLEIIEAGAAAREAGDDPSIVLAPEIRDRYAELSASYARFCDDLERGTP